VKEFLAARSYYLRLFDLTVKDTIIMVIWWCKTWSYMKSGLRRRG